jgi:hypothetical protein
VPDPAGSDGKTIRQGALSADSDEKPRIEPAASCVKRD